MNNPLAQQAQYYLNESDRLSEELNSEVEYSAVLEAVLEELVGTENFLKIMEVYSNPGSINLTASGGIRSDKPGRNNRANVTKRIGQLGKIVIARQSKPGPDADVTGIPARKAMGNDGARKVPLETRGDVDAQIARDKQGVRDAALAFRTHGGQVDTGSGDVKRSSVTYAGNLLPSPSNDNNLGIPMKDAKSLGFPVHINPGENAAPSDFKQSNAERLQRLGVRTQAALDREAFSDRNPTTIGQLAKSRNAEKAKKQRIAAGQDAATRSGMVTMQDHYDPNLVQNIMNLLTNSRNENVMDEGIIGTAVKKTGNVIKRAAKTTGSMLNSLDKDDGENINYLGKDGKPIPKTEFNKLISKKPINSSYEPDLVQGIMNLLVSNKNENDLSEGQARMNRLSSAANKQQRNTGTVEPGLRSALDQAAGNQITRALGKTQYNTGQEIRGGNMVSSAQMGGAITPHQQALQNGDRLTGIKPDYANFGVGMGERSIVSANNRTGNFHPENDSAGGVFGHVTRVQKDGAILADRMQDQARIANARSGIKLGSRSATSRIAVDRLRK